jgi:hypothetical protein
MILYEYAPQKNLRRLSGIVIILVCVALGLFLVTSVFQTLPYRWALQLCGFGCIAAIIYMTVKYISKTVVYAVVKKKDGELDLTVTEVTNGGKSRVTVCRISLSNIEEICIFDKGSDTDKIKADKLAARAKREGRKVFNYCQNMTPERVCALLVTECEEPLLIRLESDVALEKYFSDGLDFSTEE